MEENNDTTTQTEAEVKPEAEAKVESPPTGNTQATAENPLTPIEKGENILKGIDEGMVKYEALVKRQEAAASRMMMGGKAEAGVAIKSPEEKAVEQNEADIKATMDRFR